MSRLHGTKSINLILPPWTNNRHQNLGERLKTKFITLELISVMSETPNNKELQRIKTFLNHNLNCHL